jgi:hypothetical protein
VLLTGDLSDDEFQFHATVIYACGGLVLSGDNLTQIRPKAPRHVAQAPSAHRRGRRVPRRISARGPRKAPAGHDGLPFPTGETRRRRYHSEWRAGAAWQIIGAARILAGSAVNCPSRTCRRARSGCSCASKRSRMALLHRFHERISLCGTLSSLCSAPRPHRWHSRQRG